MEKVIKFIPVIYGLLLFLGFLNYTFYYNFFSLNISSYLTTGELLLSFLQLTIPILIISSILIAVMLIPIFGEIILPRTVNEEEEKEGKPVFINKYIKQFVQEARNREFRRVSDYVLQIASLIHIVFVLVEHLFLLGFPYFVYNEVTSGEPYFLNAKLTVAVGVVWFIFFIATLDALGKRRGVDYNRVQVFFVIIFFISSIYISNKDSATSLLQGKSITSVDIYLTNDTISTNSNFVYIGQTDKYIFFRNLKDSTNSIYNLNNVLKLKFKE